MILQGNFFDFFVVFGAGVLVSFTPCVYPLLPITASIIGGLNTKGSHWQGFLLSVIYVLGVAVTYCALAAIAAWQGKTFGLWQNNPWVFVVMAALLAVFALIMLEKIPFPTLGTGLQSRVHPRGLGSLFLMGTASGFVIGPCTAPVLGTLLLYVASKQNILHAAALLLVFSYGVGASLILVGTFSGLLTRLPKSGVWLVRIKQICAVVLFLAAGIFLLRAIGLF
jgi:cytochrome c-type biogenesis protein